MGQRGDITGAPGACQRLGFDTPVFIYHIEQASRWAPAAGAAMQAMADGQFTGMTSVLTLLDVAIKPLRPGRPAVAEVYQALLGDIANLAIHNLDTRAARIGAGLRATYDLRPRDALQIGARLAYRAEAFVTNDQRLRRVKEIEIVLLDDFV